MVEQTVQDTLEHGDPSGCFGDIALCCYVASVPTQARDKHVQAVDDWLRGCVLHRRTSLSALSAVWIAFNASSWTRAAGVPSTSVSARKSSAAKTLASTSSCS